MDQQTFLMITQGAQLVGTLAPIAIDTALKIKKLLAVEGSGLDVQINVIRDGAITTADETIALIAEWKKSKGLK